MQINVLRGGDPMLFNRMLFPEATPETQQWLHSQFHRDNTMLTDMGRQFMHKATALYQQLNDGSLMQRARSVVRGVKGLLHPNAIVAIESIADLQCAKPVMQRYIMANPTIRKLYHRQLCDGYSDSYVDHEPGVVGEAHYDYRRVMNSVVVEYLTPEGQDTWKSVMYPDDLVEGDRELEADERFLILRSWDLVKEAIGLKRDPTDIFNGELEV